jgi:hypothetical protein
LLHDGAVFAVVEFDGYFHALSAGGDFFDGAAGNAADYGTDYGTDG